MDRRRLITGIGVLFGLSTAIAMIGNGCSGGFQSSGSSSSLSLGQCKDTTDIKTAPGEQAASIVYGGQVLENMMACTGLDQASARTLEEFEARKASFSEYGYAGDVTAPMMMGIAAVAVEVCNDLVNQELNLASVDRRIFNAINFEVSSISDADIAETLRRMSRSCWGRDETAEELSEVTIGVNEIVSGTRNLASQEQGSLQSRFAAVSICSGVLASLDGIRM